MGRSRYGFGDPEVESAGAAGVIAFCGIHRVACNILDLVHSLFGSVLRRVGCVLRRALGLFRHTVHCGGSRGRFFLRRFFCGIDLLVSGVFGLVDRRTWVNYESEVGTLANCARRIAGIAEVYVPASQRSALDKLISMKTATHLKSAADLL